jgi:hypothetical protein
LKELPATGAVDRALDRLGLAVLADGDVASVMTLASDDALIDALASAGLGAGPEGPGAWQRRVVSAASRYRGPEGRYRFENRLRYRILAP